VLRALGDVRIDELDTEEAFTWFLLVVEVDEADESRLATQSLLEKLQGTSRFDTARKLLALASARKEQAQTQTQAQNQAEPQPDPFLDIELGPIRGNQRQDEVTALFLRWFAGRRDVYAKQWFDRRRKRSGYYPVEAPLTPEVASAHLDGTTTVGQYLLFPDTTVSFCAIDLDLDANALAELRAAKGRDTSAVSHPALRDYAFRLIEAAENIGLPMFAEDSGHRGAHLWLFFRPRRPARAARAVLSTILGSAGLQPPEVSAEIFPRQDKLGRKGFSSLIKLPLGLHRVTLRRCHLLDQRLGQLEDPLAALKALRAPPSDLIDDVLGRRLAPFPTADLARPGAEQPEAGSLRAGAAPPNEPRPIGRPHAPELDRVPPLPPLSAETSPRSLAEALRSIEPGKDERDACERMLSGCKILRRLIAKAYRDHRLEPAEARAVAYTIGLVGPSSALAREVFEVARVSRKELDRVQLGLPSPTGCKRLRTLVPPRDRQCTCFDLPKGKTRARNVSGARPRPYATPALFAVGAVTPSEPTWNSFSAWIPDDSMVPRDPLATIAEWLRRIEERLDSIERGTQRPSTRATIPTTQPMSDSAADTDEPHGSSELDWAEDQQSPTGAPATPKNPDRPGETT
jgi:hypothetical protein